MTDQEAAKKRLAEAVRLRRKELDLSQGQLASRAGVSDETISKIERGIVGTMQARTQRNLETALGWRHGDFDTVRGGGEPQVRNDARLVPVPVGGRVIYGESPSGETFYIVVGPSEHRSDAEVIADGFGPQS